VDKLFAPAVVKASKACNADAARHGIAAEQLQHILKQLGKMTCQRHITRLDLSSCSISGQDAERLAGPGCWHIALAFLSLTFLSLICLTMRLAMRELAVLPQAQRCMS
jgi:hypothetical protein